MALTPTERMKIENYLVPGLHALDMADKKEEEITDLMLFQFVNEQPERVKFLRSRYYNAPIMDTLNAAVMRVSQARIDENMAKTGKNIDIRSRHRSQVVTRIQGTESFDTNTVPKRIDGKNN